MKKRKNVVIRLSLWFLIVIWALIAGVFTAYVLDVLNNFAEYYPREMTYLLLDDTPGVRSWFFILLGMLILAAFSWMHRNWGIVIGCGLLIVGNVFAIISVGDTFSLKDVLLNFSFYNTGIIFGWKSIWAHMSIVIIVLELCLLTILFLKKYFDKEKYLKIVFAISGLIQLLFIVNSAGFLGNIDSLDSRLFANGIIVYCCEVLILVTLFAKEYIEYKLITSEEIEVRGDVLKSDIDQVDECREIIFCNPVENEAMKPAVVYTIASLILIAGLMEIVINFATGDIIDLMQLIKILSYICLSICVYARKKGILLNVGAGGLVFFHGYQFLRWIFYQDFLISLNEPSQVKIITFMAYNLIAVIVYIAIMIFANYKGWYKYSATNLKVPVYIIAILIVVWGLIEFFDYFKIYYGAYEDMSFIVGSNFVGTILPTVVNVLAMMAIYIYVIPIKLFNVMVKTEKKKIDSYVEEKQMEQKMKYCVHCGKEILEAAVICPHRGCQVGTKKAQYSSEEDIPSIGLNIVSFLIPIVGLILYLVYQDKAPTKAKEIGKFALIGFGVSIACSVLLTACTAAMY